MRKVWGQDRGICSLIVGVKGLKKAMTEKKKHNNRQQRKFN